MKQARGKLFWLPAIIFAFLLISILLTTKGGATRFGATDVTPSAIPPEILTKRAQDNANNSATQTAFPTYIAQATQTQQAVSQTNVARPTFDFQKIYPGFPDLPSPEQVLTRKLEGKPLGNGIFGQNDPPEIMNGNEAGMYTLSDLAWEAWTYDAFITVWPGYMNASPTQGILWVQITGHHNSYNDRLVVQSPIPAGKLMITGAIGERLILNSEQGQIFYFDIPSLRFVNSLTENVPAATPIPTVNPSTQDAPDLPIDAIDYQKIDSPLDSFINGADDYDWFHFYSAIPGTITVSLIPRSGNYGLRVVLVDKNQFAAILKEDITLGRDRKQIVIPDAPSGDYLVRVWSLDGSFSGNQPYILRFDAPEPEKVVPILECVAENSDGTYTAHFGYNNPNPFVVGLDAKNHENKFEPAPNFRTGQPEGFASGRVKDWFSVLFDGNGLTWLLDGGVVTANRNSPRCP
jgi:hypothetical protein